MSTSKENLLNEDLSLKLDPLSQERKKGNNVIRLEYIGGLIDENEILDLEEKLKKAEIELSKFDKSYLSYDSFDEYLNVVFIGISPSLISSILTGVASNIVWELIKYAVKKIWFKVNGKQYFKLTTTHSQEKKDITFGVQIILDEKTSYNFRLSGDLSDELIEKSLDKALDYLKDQQPNIRYKHPYYMTYNSTNENWVKLDVEEELIKKITENKNNH